MTNNHKTSNKPYQGATSNNIYTYIMCVYNTDNTMICSAYNVYQVIPSSFHHNPKHPGKPVPAPISKARIPPSLTWHVHENEQGNKDMFLDGSWWILHLTVEHLTPLKANLEMILSWNDEIPKDWMRRRNDQQLWFIWSIVTSTKGITTFYHIGSVY